MFKYFLKYASFFYFIPNGLYSLSGFWGLFKCLVIIFFYFLNKLTANAFKNKD